MVGTALGQPHRVQDDQECEVSQGEHLLDEVEEIRRVLDAVEPGRQQHQLPGQEEAEEEGRDEAAEHQVPPVSRRAPLHALYDGRSLHHSGGKVSDPSGAPGRFR